MGERSLRVTLERAWRSPSGRALRIALAIAPLAWLLLHVDGHAVVRGFRAVGPGILALGLLGHLLNSAVVSWRWRLVLRAYGAEPAQLPSVGYLFRTNLIANYASLAPVPAADDGVRGLRTQAVFPKARPAAFLVLLAERTLGLTGLLILGTSAILYGGRAFPLYVLHLLAFATGLAACLAALAILAPAVLARRPRWRARLGAIPGGALFSRLPAPRRLTSLGLPLALSIVGHFLSAVVIWLLMSRLSGAATLGLCVQVQPLILLVMAVPITPAGLGQRELAFLTLYGAAGIPAAAAVATSLLSFTLALIQAGIGGGVYAWERLGTKEGVGPGGSA